jgi:hypothetical protein
MPLISARSPDRTTATDESADEGVAAVIDQPSLVSDAA